MRVPALTTRLILAATGAVVIAVGALGASAVWIVDHELRASLDSSLRARASDVARLSVSAPAVLNAPGALEGTADGRQLLVEVHDRRGRILARSLSTGARLLPRPSIVARALRRGRSGYATVSLSGRTLRLFAGPLAEAGGPASGGVVLVAAGTGDIAATTHRLRGLVALCALVAAAAGALGAAILTRRGLRPLRRLAAAVRGIERTQDTSARLPGSEARDEIGQLSKTLNAMLASLDSAQRRERSLLADASHELRTPITALAGNIEHLARHGLDDELLRDLQYDVARLRRLVADLLVLERESAADAPTERLRLDQVVSAAVRDRPRARLAECSPAVVSGDPETLRRALDNLLDNAEIHGPPDGMVLVDLHVLNGTAELSVTDSGSGLPPVDVERAFNRFWRGADARGRPGSGLGLAIVKAAAERHGGGVTVDGARVALTIPLSPAG